MKILGDDLALLIETSKLVKRWFMSPQLVLDWEKTMKKTIVTIVWGKFKSKNIYYCFVITIFLLIFFFRFCDGFQIPCSKCTDVRFCSEACLLDAEQSYHPFECQNNAKSIGKFFEDVLSNVSFISIIIVKSSIWSKIFTKQYAQ